MFLNHASSNVLVFTMRTTSQYKQLSWYFHINSAYTVYSNKSAEIATNQQHPASNIQAKHGEIVIENFALKSIVLKIIENKQNMRCAHSTMLCVC